MIERHQSTAELTELLAVHPEVIGAQLRLGGCDRCGSGTGASPRRECLSARRVSFYWLRHTAGSLTAVAGLDPPVASERMGHTAAAHLDKEGTTAPGFDRNGSTKLFQGMGAPGIEPG
jgi:hypothetical protein